MYILCFQELFRPNIYCRKTVITTFNGFTDYMVINKSKDPDLYASLQYSFLNNITNTWLYSFDPLKPQFYIVKLGFIGVYIIFLISAQKHRLWVLVRTALMRRFSRVPTIFVLSRNKKKYQSESFYMKYFSFGGEIFYLICYIGCLIILSIMFTLFT